MDINYLKNKPFYLSDEESVWVSEMLAGMTDKEKCAQLFNLLGDNYSEDELHSLIKEYGLGGVLFRPAPTAEIARKFAEAESCSEIPLLKAANLEEGGAGIVTDGTFFGNALQVAAAGDGSYAEGYAACCAKEGRKAGVNWTFSPVVDIDFNFMNPITNVRTFGNDPDRIIENAGIYTDTVQKYGVAASCKHFPGDGVDYRDQHNHPTYNTLSADEWFDTYGKVYRSMIDRGVLSVMVGHIVQPALIRKIDPENGRLLPGSQSKELMTNVLRGELGFNGLIITDATLMGGYTMTMPRRESIPLSIASGADMLCFTTDFYEDIAYLEDALADGRLTMERLNEAVSRVLALKVVLNRDYPEVNTDCRADQIRCADAAVTLVKDDQALIPLSADRFKKVKLVILGEDRMYDGSLSDSAKEFLESRGFETELYDPAMDKIHGPGSLSADRLTLVLANCPTASFRTSVRLEWTGGLSLELPRYVNEEAIAFISFSNPYHLQDVPCVKTFINAYSADKAAVRAALGKLLGESEFTGISPADPFCGDVVKKEK